MPTRTADIMTRQDFQDLLDVYGADRTRWPLSARASAAAVLTADKAAVRMLSEAAALDAVLARGMANSAPSADATAALAARIVAAAGTAPRTVASSDKVPASPRLGYAVLSRRARPTHRPGHRSAPRYGQWRAAAMLAASLVLGVFVGQTQFGAHALPKIAALAGVSFVSPERLAMAEIELESSDVD
jgi:hypothetical protein